MTEAHARRPIPLAVIALAAFFIVFAALVITNGNDARAHGKAHQHATAVRAPAAISRKELVLRNGMRKLWEDHIVWTRLAIISLTTSGNWTADVAAYDRIHRHALHMADLLSSGLVKQFPRRFR